MAACMCAGKTKVDVQTRNGAVTTVVIEAGTNGPIRMRNPWPGKPVDVISGKTARKSVSGAQGRLIEFDGSRRHKLPGRESDEAPARRVALQPVSGTPAELAKKLGPVQIGLFGDGQ